MIELYDYQKQAVQTAIPILLRYGVAYLALQTRTGKTLISLTIAKHINLPVLFITKLKAIPSIEADHLKSEYHLDLQVTNYEQLKNIKKQHRLIIIDEAHSVGAYPKPSLRTKMLRKLTEGCPVLLLSATPTPESFSQIYHQIWASNAKLAFVYQYSNFYAWAKDYVKVKQKYVATGQKVNDYSTAREDLIQPELDKIMLTTTQSDAGFIHTELNEIEVKCPFPEHLKRAYLDMKKDGVARIMGFTIVAESAAARLSKLHQFSGGTIIPDECAEGIIISPHKINALDEILAKHIKIALYYKFNAERDLLLSVYGEQIFVDAARFRDADSGIYISQFQSGREGINLATAEAIVFYNIDHAYLSYEQTKNRIQHKHRAVQGILYYLVTDGGLESSVMKMVRAKKNFTSSYFARIENKLIKGWN